MNRTWVRILMFGLPVVIGVGALALVVSQKDEPEKTVPAERRKAVRVIATETQDVVPRVLGYGTSRPGQVWQAVAQVAGKIIEKNPRLEVGALIAKKTVLLRIDPQEYQLTVDESSATLSKIDADLAALVVREENKKASLEIEKRSLAVTESELKRLRDLLARGTGTASDVDTQQGRYLAQLARVQDLQNELRVVPSDRLSLQANRRSNEARLASAKLAVSHCVISAPFDCRIASTDFEETQFIAAGKVLAEADGVAVAEITAQVPLGKLRHLVPSMRPGTTLFPAFMSGDVIEKLGFKAVVRLRTEDAWVEWPARVARLKGTLDAATRTVGVIVAVDKPYEQVKPGVRPPLLRGMFCAVELSGPAKSGRVLVPRAALHDGEVYVVENERLRRKKVEVAFSIQDFVCLSKGLAGNETLVVSDPVPAIDGMLLRASPDEELQSRMKDVATGRAPLR